ncbi:MAG: SCP2 sterol-binding domain-containing protein [Myxococcota bacterium]
MDAKMNLQVERFGRRLAETFEKGRRERRLEGLGTFAVIIHETAHWTVIPSGPSAGIHTEMSDEPLDFVLVMKLDLFLEMYTAKGWRPIDVDKAVAERRMAMQGDFDVFLSFLKLNEAADMLSIRVKRAG